MKGARRDWALFVIVALAVVVVFAALTLQGRGAASTNATRSPSPSSRVAVATPSPDTTPLPAPTVAGTIAFERIVTPGLGGDRDIFLVNSDGTGLRRLTDDADWEESPSWSPDGSRIAWAVSYGGRPSASSTATVWVMNADGSGKLRLTKDPVHGIHPTWSPDGTQIAFVRYWLYEGAIFVINADGSGLRRLTPAATAESPPMADAEYVSPTWAPDGRILYLQGGDLFAVTPDGSGRERLTKGWQIDDFALSPDGQRLALSVPGAGSDRIVSIPAHGGGRPVTLMRGPSAAFSWTPDGKALAIASSGWITGSRLYVVNADGSGLSAVPGLRWPHGAMDPAWRPW